MTGQGCRLHGDPFHDVTVGNDPIGIVVDDLVAGLVVAGGEVRFGHRHADAVGESLPERSGGDFDARCVIGFRVTRRHRSELAEILDFLERQIIAGQMEQAVDQRRTVAGRKHEAISIEPERIARVVLEEILENDVPHRRGAEWQTGMTGIRLLNGVDREGANRVDRERFKLSIGGNGQLGAS